MTKTRVRLFWWLAAVPLAALAAFWLVVAAERAADTTPAPPASDEAGPAAAASLPPAPPPEPATARVAHDGGWWTRSLDEGAEPPLAAADNEPFAAVLRGRLTVRQRPWVHPAGVTVRLLRCWLDSLMPAAAESAAEREPEPDEVVAVTDREGRFAMRFRPPAGELFFLIDHRGPWMDFQKVASVPRGGQQSDLGDVWLEDRGGIAGTVVDAMGKPIAGATVRAVDDPLLDLDAGLDELRAARNRGLERFRVPGATEFGPLPDWVVRRDRFLPFPVTTTDRSGTFRLAGLRPGAHDVFVQQELGCARLEDVQVAAERTTEVGRVGLRGYRLVRLRFEDEQGKPWVGAAVASLSAQLGFGAAVQRTDALGEVELGVEDPAQEQLVFGFPGGGPWIRRSWPRDGRAVRVPRPAAVTVALVDPSGAAVPQGRVRFYQVGEQFRPIDRALPASMQPVEVAPGLYRGSAPCEVVAVASADGYAPAMAQLPGSRRGGANHVLTMLPLHWITVRTVDRHGTAVPGASVRIQAHANPELHFPGAQWDALANDRVHVGRTDEQGLVRVPVWDTFLSLQADHPAFGPTPGPKLRPIPEQTVDLMLRRPARVVGRLTFHQRPASAGFRVRALQQPPPGHVLDGSGWLDEQLAVTGADGGFAFRGLDTGIWELRPELPLLPGVEGAAEPGSSFRAVQVMVAEDQELHLTLEAERTALATPQLAGTIRLDGVPLAGALVRLREPTRRAVGTGPPTRVRRDRGGRTHFEPADAPIVYSHHLTTDSFGDFAFADLRPDTDYELRVDVLGQDRLQFLQRRVVRTGPGTLASPVRADVDLTTGSLQLTCTMHGQSAGNRMLRLRQVGSDGGEFARFEVLTSAYGVATVDRLPAGRWTIEPVHGSSCRPAEFTLRPGESASLQVELSLH